MMTTNMASPVPVHKWSDVTPKPRVKEILLWVCIEIVRNYKDLMIDRIGIESGVRGPAARTTEISEVNGYLHPIILDNRFPIKIPGCQENIHIDRV